jgi:hypothetical protein
MLTPRQRDIYHAMRVPVQTVVERQALLQLWYAAAVRVGEPPQAGFEWLAANGYAETFRRGTFWRLTTAGRAAAKDLASDNWKVPTRQRDEVRG